MAWIGRIAGAILAHDDGHFFLIGSLKEPCDFQGLGLEDPEQAEGGFDPLTQRYCQLKSIVKDMPCGNLWDVLDKNPSLSEGIGEKILFMEHGSKELNHTLARSFLIRRNASVSERLWDLALSCSTPYTNSSSAQMKGDMNNWRDNDLNNLSPSSKKIYQGKEVYEASWLEQTPNEIWEIVREQVLRCV